MKRFLFILLACCVSVHLKAQTFTVGGKVLDEKGQPLPGANVKVVGTTTGTIANTNGVFSLSVPNAQARLTVSYIGYVTQEIDLQGRKNVTVTLSQSQGGLDEVVVVAYGTQKRTNISGAVGTVSAAEMRENVVDNTMNTITGRTPGVRVSTLSSQPGMFTGTQSAASTIDIRGFATYQGDGITATQSGGPLFVIDGVPTTDASQFARLDPNEIESLSVLKDATAAIYGVQAANGVILVTTRKGIQGKVKVDYTGNTGVQVITSYPHLADAANYAQLFDELTQNNYISNRSDPTPLQYSAQTIQGFANGTLPQADWLSVLFKNHSYQQQHNLTISGGSDRIQSFTNLGYFQQGGLIASGLDQDKKYNLRQTLTATIVKGLTADLNLGFNDVNYYAPATSLWSNLLKAADGGIPPTQPVYANGNPAYLNQFPSQVSSYTNIAGLINKDIGGYTNNNSRQFKSVLQLNYVIPGVDGLSAKALVAYNNNYSENYTFNKAFNEYTYAGGVYTPKLFNSPSTLAESFNQDITDDLQLSLNYDKHFGKHHFTVLGLYEQTYYAGDNINAGVQYTVDAIPTLTAGNSSTATNSGSYSKRANVSYVGRVDYDYAGKYILEGGFRDEGSSLFGPGHQWGFFPYASAAWRISEESFIKKNAKWIDNIKIRGSYGSLGDDASASGSTSFPLYATGYSYPATGNVYASQGATLGTVFGSGGGLTKGLNYVSVADPNLTWYTSKTADIGLETSFWNGKLTFEGDVFRRDRTGLLATPLVAIPTTFGANIPAENLNSDRTQGFDLTLGHNSRIGQVGLHISANIGFSRTMERHWEETPATNPWDNYRSKFTNRYTDQIRGYVVLGQFQNLQQIHSAAIQDGTGNRTVLPGDYQYADLNGDGVINQYDQKVIANGGNRPLVYFGTTIGVSWKAFTFNALIQGATDYHVMYQDELGSPFVFGNADPLRMYEDRWHLSNVFDPNSTWVPGKYPAMGDRQNLKDRSFTTINSGAGTNVYVLNGSTAIVYDGTYARLKQAQFSYSLPVKWYKKAGISKIDVLLTGYNLLTWKKSGLKDFDPEYSNQNLYGYNYPITSNFNLGVHIAF
ncbi:MAG: SusC/RagA family TonB-linked outer membrane protein, partial [Mucilaginibacter sp.]|nr:SusC/RagA family TonB-linked outer membrane protein [Mucilaginibacter sp.]